MSHVSALKYNWEIIKQRTKRNSIHSFGGGLVLSLWYLSRLACALCVYWGGTSMIFGNNVFLRHYDRSAMDQKCNRQITPPNWVILNLTWTIWTCGLEWAWEESRCSHFLSQISLSLLISGIIRKINGKIDFFFFFFILPWRSFLELFGPIVIFFSTTFDKLILLQLK